VEQVTIIVAGGSGKRMNSDIPKQFLLLRDDPVLMRTVRVFHQYDPGMEIIIVLPSDQIKYWQTICRKYRFEIPHLIVHGGKTRHHSVKNAMEKIKPGSLVAVHDGVRPLVSEALIRTCFDTAAILGNAVPVIRLTESIRMLESEKNYQADRSGFRLVQTPQVFHSDVLIGAFGQSYKPQFTDEASLVEAAGHSIHLVEGQPENFKITTNLDLCLASSVLECYRAGY
jgi:2-C-methyl-D-erythritol 4-phosphate cytidylyltransferase